jgi:hypothetical protein
VSNILTTMKLIENHAKKFRDLKNKPISKIKSVFQ